MAGWDDQGCTSAGGQVVFKLFGARPCDIDDDPWDYEAGRERGIQDCSIAGDIEGEQDWRLDKK